jgi:hypothetical protein
MPDIEIIPKLATVVDDLAARSTANFSPRFGEIAD